MTRNAAEKARNRYTRGKKVSRREFFREGGQRGEDNQVSRFSIAVVDH